MTTYTPRSETITGASLTGSSGDANRTYVLANDDAIAAQMAILRGGVSLQIGAGFTFDSPTNTVTFVARVWDADAVSINYLTTDTPTTSSTNYATTLQIVRQSGLGVPVEMETLGTGDNTEDSYDTENGNIISESYTLWYGDADDNSLSQLTETTHYSVNKDGGLILLTSAGVTLINTKKLYISYTHSPKLSDTILSTFVAASSREAEKLTGNYWGPAKTTIQYFDGYESGYPSSDKPYGFEIEDAPEFEVDYQGINSITSIEFLDRKGDTDSTVDTDYISYDDYGRIIINEGVVPNGKRNVKITYIHGYTDIPALVQELTALIGGVMSYINVTGGSYDDITSYTLGRKTFSIGEVYVNVREVIQQMKARIQEITGHLGYRFACA